MAGRNRGGYPDPNAAVRTVFVLIAINALIYLLLPSSSAVFNELAMSSAGIRDYKLWQLVTAMFLHGNFTHILLNMWGLYLFGTIIAPDLGSMRFLSLYFISGIAGWIFWLLFNWSSYALVIGASGALFGVMLATAMLHPEKEFILIFFPVPMKIKTLVIVYTIIEIISERSLNDNVAHIAHLGGFIGGYVYIKFLYGNRVPWDLLGFIFGRKNDLSGNRHVSGATVSPEKDSQSFNSDAPVAQAELDRLLDKISRAGINSLSEAEMATLRRAREQMRHR